MRYKFLYWLRKNVFKTREGEVAPNFINGMSFTGELFQWLSRNKTISYALHESLFIEINAWQKETFPYATAFSKICHLQEEIAELKHDLIDKNPDRRLEFADCFLLLFGCAAADGMSLQDIVNAIEEKMQINKQRNWGKPDANGVVKHIQ